MKHLLILSGKGGTGKTTVASAFIRLSNAKAYADCDVDAPNLHLGLEKHNNPHIYDFYGMPKAKIDYKKCQECGKCQDNCRFDAITFDNKYHIDYYSCEGCGVCEYICPYDAIRLLPAISGKNILYKGDKVFSTAELKMGSGNSGKLVSSVKKILKDNIKEDTNLAIIDGSPGIGCPVIASISGVDAVLIVAEPSVSGISDMKRIINVSKGFGCKVIVCVNKYDINKELTIVIKKQAQAMNCNFAGTIPYDKAAIEAINSKRNIMDIPSQCSNSIKEVYKNTMDILFKEQK